MGTTHRTKLEMQIEMLRLLQIEDRITTHLMYGCMLNQSKGAALLQDLTEKDLVAWNETTGKFYLTGAGSDCLEAYAALRRLI